MKRRKIGYAKLGRSMPLTLDKCGSLGGDNEMVPTIKLLAERHPDVDFYLIGRNSGEVPTDVGLPGNVYNPWTTWQSEIRKALNYQGLSYGNLAVKDHIKVRKLLCSHTEELFLELDGIVMWLGQHGTTNTPLPSIRDRNILTKPYDWATLYGSYLLQGINTWRDVDPLNREEVLLNADARNYVKYRDSKWPWRHPVLAQYTHTNTVKHERYGDPDVESFNRFLVNRNLTLHMGWDKDGHLWISQVRNVYSRLEISSLVPGTPFADTIKFNDDYNRPHDFGIVFNETRREVPYGRSRRHALDRWVLPNNPGFIHGKWSDKTLDEMKVDIRPIELTSYLAKLQSARCTLTTPASGSGWATAKPWESFAAGVVCFFHPDYDDQNNILGDAPADLRDFLRVTSPAELRNRIDMMTLEPAAWRTVVRLQREHFDRAVAELHYLHLIEKRLGL